MLAGAIRKNTLRPLVGYFVGGGYNASTESWITATGVDNDALVSPLNTAVVAMKGGTGTWDRLIAIYPMIGANPNAHKFNLKNPTDSDSAKRLSFSSSGWTHGPTGSLPNGTSGYADTFINFNEDCPQYSMSCHAYIGTTSAPVGDRTLWGVVAGSGSNVICQYTGSVIYSAMGDAADASCQVSGISNFGGMISQTALAFATHKLFKNGTQVAQSTTTRDIYNPDLIASRALTLLLGCNNSVGTRVEYSNYEYRFAAFGYGMSDAQVQELNTIVTALQTSLGRVA